MVENKDIPINMIFINDNIAEERESLIDSYFDIIKSCIKDGELKPAIEMIVEEVEQLNERKIFTRLVQHMAEMIEKQKTKA
jgi:hypothetical protein